MKTFLVNAALLFGGMLALPNARAVTLGQIDTFQDGTTENWGTGGLQPGNFTDGGPAGVGDNFMDLNADGAGPNGRLTVFNRTQWLGDYIGAGINEIDMDLENLGSVTLSIRIAFKAATGNGSPGYLSAAISLPADSTWHHASFQITAATMTEIASPDAFGTFFANDVAELRIINEADNTNLNGDAVTAQMGVDNILAVPEPSAVGLLLVSALGIGCLGRRRLAFAAA